MSQNPYAAPKAEEAPPVLRFKPSVLGSFARAGVLLVGLGEASIGLGTAFLLLPPSGHVAPLPFFLGVGLGLPTLALGILSGLGSIVPFLYGSAKNAYALGLTPPEGQPASTLLDFVLPLAALRPGHTSRELARGLGAEESYPIALTLWWPLWLIAIALHVLAPFSWFAPCLILATLCGIVSCVFAFRVFWNLEAGMRQKAGLPARRLI